MDYIRDCYRGEIQMWHGDISAIPVRWFKCPEGAGFLTGTSVLRSSYWYDPNDIVPPIGELPNRQYGSNLCVDTWGFAGRRSCGSRRALLEGGVPGRDPPIPLAEDGAALCCDRVLIPRGGVEIGGEWMPTLVSTCCSDCGGIPEQLQLTMVAVGGMEPPDPNLNTSAVLDWLPDLQRWQGYSMIGPTLARWIAFCREPAHTKVGLLLRNEDTLDGMEFTDTTPTCAPFSITYPVANINPFSAEGEGIVTLTPYSGP